MYKINKKSGPAIDVICVPENNENKKKKRYMLARLKRV